MLCVVLGGLFLVPSEFELKGCGRSRLLKVIVVVVELCLLATQFEVGLFERKIV